MGSSFSDVAAYTNPGLRLPELADELQSLLKQTELRLRKLPKPPPENPVAEVIEMVSGFSRSLSTYVEGTPDEQGIHQTIRPLHMKFSKAIRDTAPDFRPYKAGETMPFIPPCFLTAEKTELGGDEGAIYVDRVMDMALQYVELTPFNFRFADPSTGPRRVNFLIIIRSL